MDKKFNPDDIVNFGSVSRLFANNRSSITRSREGSHKKDINDLRKAIREWYDNLSKK